MTDEYNDQQLAAEQMRQEVLDPWGQVLALAMRPDAAYALRELVGFHSYWSEQLSKARKRIAQIKLKKGVMKSALHGHAVASLQASGAKTTVAAIAAWVELSPDWGAICDKDVDAAYTVDVLTGKLATLGIIKTALREESQTRIASMHFERGA